tara:strand:+ start:9051 stop:9428 length:378 start_codon:yes stop_codon:yes gene_type:complete
MATVGNVNDVTSAVVLDTRMWAGSDPASTAWLQSPVGSNAAAGALNLLIVDLVTPATGATTLNISTSDITGLNGATVEAVLGLTNITDSTKAPTTEVNTAGGATVGFTVISGGDGDTHRLTILYR